MKIETRTTGFSSPAADYAHSRLTLCEEKLEDPYFTFYFRISPQIKMSVDDEILIVSRKEVPKFCDTCVGVKDRKFVVYEFGQKVDSHWGVVIGRTFQV